MTEETFVRELERRADDVHGVPLTFETVRGRAVRIRRRRRVATAAAVAAVVAVVVAPFALTGGTDQSAPDPAPAPPVAPGTSVLHERVLTLPDGETIDLPVDNADVSELGVLTDGRIVATLTDSATIRVFGPDGAVQASYPSAYASITMSAADDAVAWVGEDLRVQVLASGVAEPVVLDGIPMPGEAAGVIDAVLDADHLLVGDGTTTTGTLTTDGYTELATPEPFRVVDVSPDGALWAVTTLPDETQQYGCTGLYDPEARKIVTRSCDVYPLGFSPDGRLLLSGFFENNMVGDVSIVDLDLERVATLDPGGATTAVSRFGWSDPGHVLAGLANWQTSDWTLTRFDVDGGSEALAGRSSGLDPELAAEYVMSE
ncbi:hypothetical protein GON03_16810 [Nocardioides sp. MAH-18]|uniref:WD40 repeat domain-containing protein n=1 Tax=Nocardioides agri TaxID=2682843 RepID=A0A6L6XUI3_9ACTN|nr:MULTISPECIES: hypothetical protein [unclassified Nocardioides]MBA2956001.1 hypothetical protein [Nocardioides sp. CGMCC 1.13656]MVQ50849.1 hypothetical protein [Nocardioides sp. MAH-18]